MNLHQCHIHAHIRNYAYILSRCYVNSLKYPTAGIIG